MNNKEIVTDVLKDNLGGIGNGKKSYLIPLFSDDKKAKIITNFDKRIKSESIVAYVDATLVSSYLGGILFTDRGFYHKVIFGENFYYKYDDVNIVYNLVKNEGKTKKNEVRIILKDGSVRAIKGPDYNKRALQKAIERIKNEKVSDLSSENNHPQTGLIAKSKLTKEQQNKCMIIINGASASAGAVGAGLSQIPLADNTIIVPIQIGMIISIGNVLGFKLSENIAYSILLTIATSIIGRGFAQIAVGWIPGFGNIINAATASGITQLAGWATVEFLINSNKDDIEKKFNKHYKGSTKTKAEMAVELDKTNKRLKKLNADILEFADLRKMIFAITAIGVAAANIDGEITDEEAEIIKQLTFGATRAVFSDKLKELVQNLYDSKPNFEKAMNFVNKVDYKYWDEFKAIFIMIFKVDTKNINEQIVFRFKWDQECLKKCKEMI